MILYNVYAIRMQNGIGNEQEYIQSIIARNKKHACDEVSYMVENRATYKTGSYFAVKDPKHKKL